VDPFVFHTPTKITFGQGVAASAADAIQETSGSRIIVITDKQLLKTDLVNYLVAQWQSENHISVFSDVLSDAHLTGVNEAVRLAKNEKCNAVIALGGGSVIDTAKVVNIVLTLGGEALDHQGMNNLSGRLLPSVAIPTTAGTGAEVSLVAMVKDDVEGKKMLFGSPFLAADQAFLDPELIVSLPAHLTAATGMDAVAHCIEALVVEGTSSPLTDCLSLDALNRLFTYLPEAKKDGRNLEARSQTLVASTMAGMSFSSCGVGIVHALSHAIGGQFATHHGMTNAVLLPHGMRFNLSFATKRYAETARYLKLSNKKNDSIAARELIESIETLISDLGLPKNLRGLSVPELDGEKMEQLVALASSDPAMIFNTRQATEKDIVQIYEDAY
jgi:alcohol dehydrogenase class IV